MLIVTDNVPVTISDKRIYIQKLQESLIARILAMYDVILNVLQ